MTAVLAFSAVLVLLVSCAVLSYSVRMLLRAMETEKAVRNGRKHVSLSARQNRGGEK